MEGRGGCCVTRYAAGAYDVSKVETIMRKFRPIAPKPLAAGGVSDGSSSESGDAFSRSGGGAKKKCAKGSKGSNRCNRRRRKTAPSLPRPATVTLPLLPETPDPKDPPAARTDTAPAWLSLENRGRESTPAAKRFDLTATGSAVVTVECVTDTWREEEGERLGISDEETMRGKLSEDTCPGFISDGYGRVTWTNGAFNGMVGGGDGGEVWLVTKVVGVPCVGGFTCKVRVQREKSTDLTVLCDVWRIMDGGGFAWRLDVKAALTLSLAL